MLYFPLIILRSWDLSNSGMTAGRNQLCPKKCIYLQYVYFSSFALYYATWQNSKCLKPPWVEWRISPIQILFPLVFHSYCCWCFTVPVNIMENWTLHNVKLIVLWVILEKTFGTVMCRFLLWCDWMSLFCKCMLKSPNWFRMWNGRTFDNVVIMDGVNFVKVYFYS